MTPPKWAQKVGVSPQWTQRTEHCTKEGYSQDLESYDICPARFWTCSNSWPLSPRWLPALGMGMLILRRCHHYWKQMTSSVLQIHRWRGFLSQEKSFLSFTHPWFRWYLDEIPTWSWCRNGLRLWGSGECLLHMRRLRILKAGCYWLNCVTPEFRWLPWCLSGSESTWQSRRHRRCRFDPWVGKILWKMKWQTTPVFLTGIFHGQRSLVDHSTWSCKRVRHNWASGQQQKFKHWGLNCGIAEFNHIWRKSP